MSHVYVGGGHNIAPLIAIDEDNSVCSIPDAIIDLGAVQARNGSRARLYNDVMHGVGTLHRLARCIHQPMTKRSRRSIQKMCTQMRKMLQIR